jgi:hypothetical protein
MANSTYRTLAEKLSLLARASISGLLGRTPHAIEDAQSHRQPTVRIEPCQRCRHLPRSGEVVGCRSCDIASPSMVQRIEPSRLSTSRLTALEVAFCWLMRPETNGPSRREGIRRGRTAPTADTPINSNVPLIFVMIRSKEVASRRPKFSLTFHPVALPPKSIYEPCLLVIARTQ